MAHSDVPINASAKQIEDVALNGIKSNEQTLSSEAQSQARKNINAMILFSLLAKNGLSFESDEEGNYVLKLSVGYGLDFDDDGKLSIADYIQNGTSNLLGTNGIEVLDSEDEYGNPVKLIKFDDEVLANFTTHEYVNGLMSGKLTRIVFGDLEEAITWATTADDREDYIYMIPSENSENGNVYDEYMWIDGNMDFIGSTAVDLSGYAKEEDLDAFDLPRNIRIVSYDSSSVTVDFETGNGDKNTSGFDIDLTVDGKVNVYLHKIAVEGGYVYSLIPEYAASNAVAKVYAFTYKVTNGEITYLSTDGVNYLLEAKVGDIETALNSIDTMLDTMLGGDA